jgi:hypothetical protein
MLQMENSSKYNSGNLRSEDLLPPTTVQMFSPLSLSFAPYVKSSRTLLRWLKPIATWYANAAGYRKYGFKYDDLRT